MAKVRRTIQKVERAETTGFDDQLWPINLALLVLTGFVAGITIAAGGFDDPRLLHNGWFRLIALGLTAGGLFWLSLSVSRQIARRMQLAILLSLILHISLALVLKDRILEVIAQQAVEQQELVEQDDLPLLPEYILPPLDQPLTEQAFERPVETETPMPDAQAEPVEREQTTPREVQPQVQPVTMPQPQPTTQPSPVELQRQQMSAPHRAEETSKLSRQVELAQNREQAAIAVPTQSVTANEQQARPLDAPSAEVARRQTRVEASQQKTTAEPTTIEQRQQVQIVARASRAEMTPETSSAPTLQRQVAQPAAVPRADAVQAEMAQAAQPTEAQTLSPTSEVLKRTQAAGPQPTRQSTEPALDPPTRLAESDTARRQPAELQPALAQAERSSPNKRRVEMEVTPEPVATPESTVAAQPSPDAAPGPASTSLARSMTELPRTMSPEPLSSEAPRQSEMSHLAQVTTPRAQAAPTPSLQPETAPAARPQRSLTAAESAATPASIDSPAVAQSATQDRPAAKPSNTSLSKARSGFIGQGRSQNADVAMPSSAQNTAPVASAAARRQMATETETGPALSPSQPAQIAKSAAGSDVPAATAQAEDVEVADLAGAQQPAMLAQPASAAMARSKANAPLSETSAAMGHVEVDTGPTQIMPENSSGRASGGGQPRIAVNAQEQTIERTRPGGAALAALPADDVATTPVAPADQGGGAPAGPTGLEVADLQPKWAGGPPASTAQPMLKMAAGSAGLAGEVRASSPRRAASTEALPGMTAGGGTSQPTRGKGREIAMLTPSEVPQIEAVPHEGGAPRGQPLDASGDVAGRAASGLPGKTTNQLVGAAAGPVPVDAPAVGELGTGLALAKATQGNEGLPTVGAAEQGAPLKKSSAVELPAGLIADAEPVEMAGMPSGAEVDGDTPSGADLPTARPARVAGSLPVRVSAPNGPGGLGLRFTTDVGLPSRRAQREAEIVHQVPQKFLQKKIGGAAVLAGTARQIAEPFARRGERHDMTQSSGEGKPSAKTEAAIELGLDFLARHQAPDGSWSFNGFGQGRPGYEAERAAIQADTAATGLALLAFLGAGYDHFDDKHQERVAAALNYLVKNQREDGDLYLPQDDYTNRVAQLYSHGIAAIALCEAYGMTGDPQLRKPAQRAIDFIVASQHEQRGGWRYTPGYMSDLSVTGWQLMALRSGELAGLEVPQETYERVIKFLERCQANGNDGARYVYNPYAANTPAQAHGRHPSTVMTSVGLLMRLYTGWNREHPDMIRGADHLLANLPMLGTQNTPARTGTLSNPLRDTYYWYYATQVMFHMKGKYWQSWNDTLHPLLVATQTQTGPLAGSWDPRRPVPDKWGPHGGRIYITTMNLLSLEVYYRHLPIYEETAK